MLEVHSDNTDLFNLIDTNVESRILQKALELHSYILLLFYFPLFLNRLIFIENDFGAVPQRLRHW